MADVVWIYPAYGLAAVVTFLNEWTPGASTVPLILLFALWAGAIVVRVGGQYLARTLGYAASERTSLDTQTRPIEHLYHLDIAWHERENAGGKLKRICHAADDTMHMITQRIARFQQRNSVLALWEKQKLG